MPRTTGPLWSHDARKGLKDSITYRRTPRGTTCQRKHRPRQPRTTAQLAVRTANTFFCRTWATLTDAQQQTWANRALLLGTSPYHAWLAQAMRWWDLDLGPAKADPRPPDAPAADTPQTYFNPNAHPSIHHVHQTNPPDVWYWQLSWSIDADHTPGPKTHNALKLKHPTDYWTIWTFPEWLPGLYYMYTRGVTPDGATGPWKRDVAWKY